MKQDVLPWNLCRVVIGTWFLLYFVVFPTLFVSNGEKPIPAVVMFTVSAAITWIVLRSSRHYWTKEHDEHSESEG